MVRVLGMTWMAAWLVITMLIAVLGPWMEGWPLAARTLALSGVMVPISTLVVMPFLTERLSGWLRGERALARWHAEGAIEANGFAVEHGVCEYRKR